MPPHQLNDQVTLSGNGEMKGSPIIQSGSDTRKIAFDLIDPW